MPDLHSPSIEKSKVVERSGVNRVSSNVRILLSEIWAKGFGNTLSEYKRSIYRRKLHKYISIEFNLDKGRDTQLIIEIVDFLLQCPEKIKNKFDIRDGFSLEHDRKMGFDNTLVLNKVIDNLNGGSVNLGSQYLLPIKELQENRGGYRFLCVRKHMLAYVPNFSNVPVERPRVVDYYFSETAEDTPGRGISYPQRTVIYKKE